MNITSGVILCILYVHCFLLSVCTTHCVCVCAVHCFDHLSKNQTDGNIGLHVKINSIVLSSKDLLLKALINGNNERERKSEINWRVCAMCDVHAYKIMCVCY